MDIFAPRIRCVSMDITDFRRDWFRPVKKNPARERKSSAAAEVANSLCSCEAASLHFKESHPRWKSSGGAMIFFRVRVRRRHCLDRGRGRLLSHLALGQIKVRLCQTDPRQALISPRSCRTYISAEKEFVVP